MHLVQAQDYLRDQENRQRFPTLARGKKHPIDASSAAGFIQVMQQRVSISADALKIESSLVVASRQGQQELLSALRQSKLHHQQPALPLSLSPPHTLYIQKNFFQ